MTEKKLPKETFLNVLNIMRSLFDFSGKLSKVGVHIEEAIEDNVNRSLESIIDFHYSEEHAAMIYNFIYYQWDGEISFKDGSKITIKNDEDLWNFLDGEPQMK